MIPEQPKRISYNERGATEPYDPCEVFPPELTESNRKMARQRARGGLQKHIRHFGPDGLFTFRAGLCIEQAAEIGAERLKRSQLHKFKVGDWVIILGTKIAVPVEQTHGMFLTLRSYGWGNCTEFHRVNPPHGRYVYGRIEIYKGHVELAEWSQ